MSAPAKKQEPVITSITDLPNHEAKWTALKKINFTDEAGQPRTWEMATRSTRGRSGVDAVAIGNVILRPHRPASTVLAIQYRPPLDAYTVEWPAGLVDADETPEQAAVRELREETGYEVTRVLSVGPTVASDPGLTNANIQLVMVEVRVEEGQAEPEQRLEDGEHITRVTVPLAELYDRLVEFSERDKMVVAAKLFHFAAGMRFARSSEYV